MRKRRRVPNRSKRGLIMQDDAFAGSEVSATDSSGCVRTTVDQDGRLIGLRLTAQWRTRLGADALPEAILQAMTQAVTERWTADSDLEEPITTVDISAEYATAFHGMSEQEAQQADLRIIELLQAALDESRQKQAGVISAVPLDLVGADVRRHVTATVTAAGYPSGVVFNQKWLSSAPTERIVETVREAFEAAYRALDESLAPSQAASGTASRELRRLTTTPGALSAWARGGTDGNQ